MSKYAKFYDLSEDTINTFMAIVKKKYGIDEVAFQFIGNVSQKAVVKISKLPEQYEYLLNNQILVTMNEDIMAKFDSESIDILIEQEIDKITFNAESSKVKLVKTDINTFSTLITKWGIEKISKANQLAEITAEITVRGDLENDFIS